MERTVYFFLLLSLITITFTIGCRNAASESLCVIHVFNKNNKKIPLQVEIADTFATQQRGLMFRKKMGKNRGMIFVFKKARLRTFWMKNTYIPLSIAYISAQGMINEIYHMKPLDVSITYPSLLPAKYALEVNKGWFSAHNVTERCRVDFNGCISK